MPVTFQLKKNTTSCWLLYLLVNHMEIAPLSQMQYLTGFLLYWLKQTAQDVAKTRMALSSFLSLSRDWR